MEQHERQNCFISSVRESADHNLQHQMTCETQLDVQSEVPMMTVIFHTHNIDIGSFQLLSVLTVLRKVNKKVEEEEKLQEQLAVSTFYSSDEKQTINKTEMNLRAKV